MQWFLVYFEPSLASFTKTACSHSYIIILLIFSFKCHEVFLLLLLIKSIFSIPVLQSILLELQWLFPEIICSKQLLWLQPCQYHWSCGICRCWDWRRTGMKIWHWEVAPMKGQTVLKLAADYGCVHTHCLLPAHSRYYGETPTVFATVAS